MKTIEEKAQEYADEMCAISTDVLGVDSGDVNAYIIESFKSGVEFVQRWIPVEEELPNEKNGYFDKQVLVKHFNDFERTELDYKVTKYNERGWEEYSRITHWRPIDFK